MEPHESKQPFNWLRVEYLDAEGRRRAVEGVGQVKVPAGSNVLSEGPLILYPLAMQLTPPPPLTFCDVDRAIEFAQEHAFDLETQVMKVNRQDWDALVGEAILTGLLDFGSGKADLMTNQEGLEWLTYKGLRIEHHKDPTIKRP